MFQFFIILLQSIAGYLILSFANKYTDSSIVAASNTIQPIAVAILTWAIFQELITLRQLSGAGLIIAGLFIVTYQKYQENKAIMREQRLSLKIKTNNDNIEPVQMNGHRDNDVRTESDDENNMASE
jgi:multidrug transporter EmrE-like cation transporter